MDRHTAILHLESGDRAIRRGLVRRTLGVLPGVVSLALDRGDSVAVVRYQPEGPRSTDLPALVRALEDAGLRVSDVAIRTDRTDLRSRPVVRLKARTI